MSEQEEKGRSQQPPDPQPEPPVTDVQEQVAALREEVLARRSTELHDLTVYLSSKRRMTALNFFLGLARGIGFFLGVSLIGAAVVALAAWAVDWTADTFQSRYDTRTIVRLLTEKYTEVREEIDRAERQRSEWAELGVGLPSASGAQLGALLSLAAQRPAAQDSSQEPLERERPAR